MASLTRHLVLLALLGVANRAAAGECDRACMNVILDRYLYAAVTNDPEAAPLAVTYRGTENQHPVAAGEGIWASAAGLGPMQRRFTDTHSGQVAFYGILIEDTGPALISLRLRVVDRAVTESEAVIARKGEPLFDIEQAIAEQPSAGGPADSDLRVSRAALAELADQYFQALADSDGSALPKVDGCTRVENGTRVTQRQMPGAGESADDEEAAGGDCTDGFERFAGAISDVAFRRFPVVDTEAGVVLGIGLFQRPSGATWRDGSPRRRNLIHEYFAAERGKLTEIFAVMRYLDPEEPNATGWQAGTP